MRPLLATLALTLVAATGFAHSIHPGGFPDPMSPTAAIMGNLYNVIFIIIAVIAFVVALPIGYVLWRFRASRNSRPATFTHHIGLELLWTIIPAIICIFIAYESYLGMIKLRTMPTDGVNIEVVAYQFGWDFYYPDASENGVHVKAETPSTPDPALSKDHDRLVPELVVPAGKPIILHVTSADVIHAFFNPQLGVKIDAFPGRINYAWFQANKPGTYLGQCAELCGSNHSDMFFKVRAVSDAEFADYIKARRVEAGLPAVPAVPVSDTTMVSGTVKLSPVTAVSPDTVPLVGHGVTATVKVSETILPSTSNPQPK